MAGKAGDEQDEAGIKTSGDEQEVPLDQLPKVAPLPPPLPPPVPASKLKELLGILRSPVDTVIAIAFLGILGWALQTVIQHGTLLTKLDEQLTKSNGKLDTLEKTLGETTKLLNETSKDVSSLGGKVEVLKDAYGRGASDTPNVTTKAKLDHEQDK